MNTSKELLVEQTAHGVMTITMNRPEVHNAFDDHQVERLKTTLQSAEEDPAIRVVILASNGKSFSAGGDINYMRRMSSNSYAENLDDASKLAALMETLNFLSKPTIARVQGAAMGGGVGLVSCCDYAVASTTAKFALSEVKLGMLPATIAPYVVNSIGEKAARRLFMSAQPIDANQALALGLLSDVVDERRLDDTISSLAKALINNAPNAIRLAKELAINIAREQGNTDIKQTAKLIADVRDSDEGREGLNAFLEKRRPNWTTN